MEKARYLLIFSLLISVVILYECTTDDIGDKQKFVGRWTISEVTYDGVIQPEWVGTKIFFNQTSYNSGTYSLLYTQSDSIWNSSGIWTTTDNADSFLRDDNIPITYGFYKDNTLKLAMYLPWTQHSTCTDSVCLPVVTGQWTFELNGL